MNALRSVLSHLTRLKGKFFSKDSTTSHHTGEAIITLSLNDGERESFEAKLLKFEKVKKEEEGTTILGYKVYLEREDTKQSYTFTAQVMELNDRGTIIRRHALWNNKNLRGVLHEPTTRGHQIVTAFLTLYQSADAESDSNIKSVAV